MIMGFIYLVMISEEVPKIAVNQTSLTGYQASSVA
jgi:hypothetical protein